MCQSFFLIKLRTIKPATIVCRNTWLGNQKILIIDLIVNIILDYLKKTSAQRMYYYYYKYKGGVFCKSMEVPK